MKYTCRGCLKEFSQDNSDFLKSIFPICGDCHSKEEYPEMIEDENQQLCYEIMMSYM